ncbi:hypothetical protein V6N12_045129 [Hibiscus sabdariffa]|uniref:Uncharacterized protein n=1 Tax=Hibiscus sabdariffa TaxID=183260 RepID=A0ABR2G1V0_9ROSI
MQRNLQSKTSCANGVVFVRWQWRQTREMQKIVDFFLTKFYGLLIFLVSSKFEGIVPVSKLRERSTAVIEGSVDISHGIIPPMESGILLLSLAELAENICKLGALQMLLGNAALKKFSKMLRNCNVEA